MSAPVRRVPPLRRRMLTVTLAVTAVALIAFGIPLGVALTSVEHDRAVLRLEREASRVLASVPDEQLTSGRPFPLPQPLFDDDHQDSTQVGVYSSDGRLLSGRGPATSALARRSTAAGHVQSGSESGGLAVAEPLRADRPGSAAIRVSIPQAEVEEELRESAALMVALAAGVLLVTGTAAYLLARRMSRPLEELASTATRLGDGDFAVRGPSAGIREIHDVARAFDRTASRLRQLIERERAFTANASHQIRTPLTALRVNLESAPLTPGASLDQVSADAVAQLDRLEATLDQLLSLTRDTEPPGALLDIPALLDDARDRWHLPVRHSGRQLACTAEPNLPAVRASGAGVAHALDVLIDNALVHGAGTVTVTARTAGRAVAVDIHDDGVGVRLTDSLFDRRDETATGHGIGLALARSLVEADGGRLDLTDPGPGPVFTILLPAANLEGSPSPPAHAEFR